MVCRQCVFVDVLSNDQIVCLHNHIHHNHTCVACRLCVFVETNTGRDPIEIMHTEELLQEATVAPMAKAAAAAAGRAAFAAGAAAASATTPLPHAEPPSPRPSSGGWFSAFELGSKKVSPQSGRGQRGGQPPTAGTPLEPLPGHGGASEEVVAADHQGMGRESGASFVWRGADTDAVLDLEEELLKTRAVSSVRIDGGNFSRLPQTPALWDALARSLVSLSMNSNALVDLPAAVGSLHLLRHLSIEGNLFRSLPLPVLKLRGLIELSAGDRVAAD